MIKKAKLKATGLKPYKAIVTRKMWVMVLVEHAALVEVAAFDEQEALAVVWEVVRRQDDCESLQWSKIKKPAVGDTETTEIRIIELREVPK